MYYHRYLSLSVLEEYDGVVRDTGRNLRLLDLCGKYAADETDRVAMEQYRPYLMMMNARAAASVHLQAKRFGDAARVVADALEQIKAFYERFGQEELFDKSNEARVLRRFAREVQRKAPVDPIQRLRRRLHRAVKDERYEEAAKLRDELERQAKADAEPPVEAVRRQPGNA
jgi:excinuclease UvrABC helicase subunit UvrB